MTKRSTRTVTLTLLGYSHRHTHGHGVRGHQGREHGFTRRAMLVVRADEATDALRPRLMDTIFRLAGGPVVGRGMLVDRMIEDLHQEPGTGSAQVNWTLTHIREDAAGDPYAPLPPRLVLIDTPTRRRSWPRRAPGRWLATRPRGVKTKPQAALARQ